MKRAGLLLGLSATIAVWPAGARAGNEDELLVGNHAAMLAGAVGATVQDSSAIWYNPAGLGAIARDQVDISATVYTLRAYSVPHFITTSGGASEDGSVTEFVVVPTQIAYVRRLSPGISLGVGYFVPQASNYVLRESLDDSESSTHSHWQVAISGAQTHHTGIAALGVALSSRLRLGASLIGTYIATTQSISLFGSVDEGDETRASNSVAALATASRMSLAMNLGMQLELSSMFALGFTVRSPELQLASDISSTVNTSITSLVDPDAPVFAAQNQEDQNHVDFELLRLARVGISLTVRHARGWVTAEFSGEPGLRRPKADVDRKFLGNARIGVYHSLTKIVALGVGLFTDRSSESVAYDFVDGSADFYGGTVGIELSNEHSLAPEEREKSLVFKSVFALRYAFGTGLFGLVLADPDEIAVPFGTKRGRLNVHELGLYVGSGLHF